MTPNDTHHEAAFFGVGWSALLDEDAMRQIIGEHPTKYNQPQMRLIFAAFPSLNDAYCECLHIKVAFIYWMLPLYLASLSWNIFCGNLF